MIVRSFHIELEVVKEELLHMGKEVDQVIGKLMDGWKEEATLEEIIQNDKHINRLELNLHNRVTLLMTKQQPVATDLRKLIAVLKISSDLERIGDLAVDISKQCKRLSANSLQNYEEKLHAMFTVAREMMNQSLQAFKQSDMLRVQDIASMDDEVDQGYSRFIKGLFRLDNTALEVDQVTQLAFIGRFIERIADYATNIAEWVVYEVNGAHLDLN